MLTASFWLYANPKLYQLVMRALYGPYFEARYEVVAAEIPPGATVIDVCAGDCYIYRKYLSQKGVDYLGLDVSPQIVRWANRHGAAAKEFNLWVDDLPVGEIVIMQASLYQFMPDARAVIRKLLAVARQRVIIAEPIRGLTASQNRLLARLSHYLTTPARAPADYTGQRFTEATLTVLFESFSAFERAFFIPGGRELVGVFTGQHGYSQKD